ncbi:MAG: rRNA ((1402)-2-O)-methyltransferase [Pseudomonadota bacterium]|jgi:16S rRNA (cytidine1402-2'-O)-methyltransferase
MLYVCATPIGNLHDITLRALEILNKADIILCEDTRNSQKLLNFHGISHKRLIALHEHNENEVSQSVLNWLEQDKTIVQISDAGTPGISDPGARLCNILYQHGIYPQPLPGACAYITLLSVSGLINHSHLFYGFLASKTTQRQKQLQQWQQVEYAVAIYESPHRIIDCMQDIIAVLGATRQLVVGRELTKQFETIRKDNAGDLLNWMLTDSNQQRGEFVILILPAMLLTSSTIEVSAEQINALDLLSEELPTKKAVNLVHKLLGGNKDAMYNYLIQRKPTLLQ